MKVYQPAAGTTSATGSAVYQLALFLFLVPMDSLLAAPPILTSLFPGGGQRGTSVTVSCTGGFPTWPVKVWAPGLEVKPAKESGKIEVVIPRDLPIDRAWIRFYNDEGASQAVPFLIDGLREMMEQEPNDAPRTAQVVGETPVIINGTLAKNADVDCFSLSLREGQTLVARLEANGRMGSPMDAILQITTPDGFVLEENNDDVNLDPLLVFRVQRPGTYLVRVFAFSSTPDTSIRLSHGATHIYRLTLTTGPLITHARPMAANLSSPGSVAAVGWSLGDPIRMPIVPYGGTRLAGQVEREALSDLRLPQQSRLGLAISPDGKAAVRVRLTPTGVVGQELASVGTSTPIIPIPAVLTGILRKIQQEDQGIIRLKKGQKVIFSVETRSIQSPFNPRLIIKDSKDAIVGSSQDVGPNREAMLVYAATRDDEYRFSVKDRFGGGSDRHWYRLTVREEEPEVDLVTGSETIVVEKGKPTEVPVKVNRLGGFAEPLTIEAMDLPSGVTVAPVVSEATGPTAASVTLKLSQAGKGFNGPIRIRGKGNKPNGVEWFAHTPPRLGAAFDTIWMTAIEKK